MYDLRNVKIGDLVSVDKSFLIKLYKGRYEFDSLLKVDDINYTRNAIHVKGVGWFKISNGSYIGHEEEYGNNLVRPPKRSSFKDRRRYVIPSRRQG